MFQVFDIYHTCVALAIVIGFPVTVLWLSFRTRYGTPAPNRPDADRQDAARLEKTAPHSDKK